MSATFLSNRPGFAFGYAVVIRQVNATCHDEALVELGEKQHLKQWGEGG